MSNKKGKATRSERKLTFATALTQSKFSAILEWRFPPPLQRHKLVGKSRAAWHTSFVIPTMGVVLDAGVVINDARPPNIFITHGHADHSLIAPVFIGRERPPDIYCPRECAGLLDTYLMAKRLLNRGGSFEDEVEEDAILVAENGGIDAESDAVMVTVDGGEDDEDADDGEGVVDVPAWYLKPVKVGEEYFLKDSKTTFVKVIRCDHNVPSVGYLFYTLSQRLKPEYRSLEGPELKALRESGTVITLPHRMPMFAFMGDTTASILAADPDWLKEMPVVITECSFLYQEHVSQAKKTKHTVWCELEPVVRKYQNTTFVLMHFSKRYKDSDVTKFFKEMQNVPTNIVVWVGDHEVNEP